jgi:hypothetical protein
MLRAVPYSSLSELAALLDGMTKRVRRPLSEATRAALCSLSRMTSIRLSFLVCPGASAKRRTQPMSQDELELVKKCRLCISELILQLKMDDKDVPLSYWNAMSHLFSS